jgi:hypothetical protein
MKWQKELVDKSRQVIMEFVNTHLPEDKKNCCTCKAEIEYLLKRAIQAGLDHREDVVTNTTKPEPKPTAFEHDLRTLINRHSLENRSNTPDYVLANFLKESLLNYEHAIMSREAVVTAGVKPEIIVKYKVVDPCGENCLDGVEGCSILQRTHREKEITLFDTREDAQRAIERTEEYARRHNLSNAKAWSSHRIVEVQQ